MNAVGHIISHKHKGEGMEEKMVVYYSFVFYCMVMFSFIACIILLCKAFGGVIFEVQTYINSKREVEVSPRGTRIFSKWFAGILGIFFIYTFFRKCINNIPLS